VPYQYPPYTYATAQCLELLNPSYLIHNRTHMHCIHTNNKQIHSPRVVYIITWLGVTSTKLDEFNQQLLLSMEALKFFLLLCLWYELASAQTTGIFLSGTVIVTDVNCDHVNSTEISANCSVTIVEDSANVTLNSNIDGTFQCTLDDKAPEICKKSRDALLTCLKCWFRNLISY